MSKLDEQWADFIKDTDYERMPDAYVAPIKTAFYHGALVTVQAIHEVTGVFSAAVTDYIAAERERRSK